MDTREQWQAFLERFEVGEPATDTAVAELEQRLGTRLPADYRAFLLVTDGGDVGELYRLFPAKEVGWARDVMADMIEAWESFDDEIAMMNRCLVVGEDEFNSYYFLDPSNDPSDGWTAIEWWTTPTEITAYPSFGDLVRELALPAEPPAGTSDRAPRLGSLPAG